ncbi:HNH endonuclease protein [Rhizobium phage RHph_N3_2]|nr:HNH endonuclease protein [Rhizobium phage RHph_N3_2]
MGEIPDDIMTSVCTRCAYAKPSSDFYFDSRRNSVRMPCKECCRNSERERRSALECGDPIAGRTSAGEPLRWVHEVALPHTGEDCLTWPYGRDRDGYGTLHVNGKKGIASRYICELVHGAPPTPRHQAAHSCGNGNEGCVSPGHIEWKTHKENMADKLLHGTHSRGERSVRAKLTEEDVRTIISLKGDVSQSKLAKKYGVSPTSISNIHIGRSWVWLSTACGNNVDNQP